jgi:hypothetical protein
LAPFGNARSRVGDESDAAELERPVDGRPAVGVGHCRICAAPFDEVMWDGLSRSEVEASDQEQAKAGVGWCRYE